MDRFSYLGCIIYGVVSTGLGGLATGAAIENEAWAWVGVGAGVSLICVIITILAGWRLVLDSPSPSMLS